MPVKDFCKNSFDVDLSFHTEIIWGATIRKIGKSTERERKVYLQMMKFFINYLCTVK